MELLPEMWIQLKCQKTVRLNPYSNGLLPETLAESILRFPHYSHSTEILTVSQRVSPIRMIFRKCMR